MEDKARNDDECGCGVSHVCFFFFVRPLSLTNFVILGKFLILESLTLLMEVIPASWGGYEDLNR